MSFSKSISKLTSAMQNPDKSATFRGRQTQGNAQNRQKSANLGRANAFTPTRQNLSPFETYGNFNSLNI
jgi:hypothetical protein